MMSTESLTGTIVYWNGKYGFIQPENAVSVFFHKSFLKHSYKHNINLLDIVSFSIKDNNLNNKNKGKPIAIDIEKFQDFDLSKYDRYIGKLIKWDRLSGIIARTSVDGKVLFYKSRRLYIQDSFHLNDLLVYCPVKSTKHNNKLFALFAYPISKEKNIEFLTKEFEKTNNPDIEKYIIKLRSDNNLIDSDIIQDNLSDLPLDKIFAVKLNKIGFINNQDAFQKLISLIKEFKNQSYHPSYQNLKFLCDDIYLIQLWEMDIIDNYDISVIKSYFINITADKKRVLISKLYEADKFQVLNAFYLKLKDQGKLNYINNDLKILLDITFRNKSTENIDVYKNIEEYLVTILNPVDIISLWLDAYIDNPSEQFIVDNFNINDPVLVKSLLSKSDENYINALQKIFENYFFEISKYDFDNELPKIVKRLRIFESEYLVRYNEIIKGIKNIFTDYQRFILWIFNVNFEFDALKYFKDNTHNINDFYKIKFFLHKSFQKKTSFLKEFIENSYISQQGIIDYIYSNPWNDLIHPTELSPENIYDCYFLPDIDKFVQNFDVKDIDINELSISIYNSLPLFQVHHLRLWLYDYVANSYYDYIGYRERYRELSKEEQSVFKKIGDVHQYINEVVNVEVLEVTPCNNFVPQTNSSVLYYATLENFYFSEGKFKLRKEDKSYTDFFDEPFSSSGLNRIPSKDSLNKIKIEIEVKDNKIINVNGLNDIFTMIHTGEIEKAMGIVVNPSNISKRHSNKSYVEDWKLRKEIIDFLSKNQNNSISTTSVYEPKNHFRRLDVDSGIDDKELTRLFTIETLDGYGIIWENIDMSEDKATYVFKASKETHLNQISKIYESITNISQFRSSLINKKDKSIELQIFKNNLGFIGSIHKLRGKNKAFDNWHSKLKKLLSMPIPNIPDDDEINSIKDWTPQVPHGARIKIKNPNINPKLPKNPKVHIPVKMDDTKIKEFNPDTQSFVQPQELIKSISDKEKILIALQSFNKYFTENLNII